MNWHRFAIVCALGVLFSRSSEARAAGPDTPRDLAAEARAVFSARCAACHGPQLSRPMGRFGYVLDLQRLARSPEMVVPSRPEESELWVLIRNNEMPPTASPSGPMTATEKETIRAWIAAGAPSGTEAPAQAQEPPEIVPETSGPGPPVPQIARRAVRWLGKFHLLLLHFPIAFLAAAAACECWSACRRARASSEAVRFSLGLAAVTALPTVGLGWLHALDGHGVSSPGLLALHRWVGTLAGVWAVGAAVLNERDVRRGVRSLSVRVVILAGALLVALAAHFGGLLAYGEDFFDV